MENEFKVIKRLTAESKGTAKYNYTDIDLSSPYNYKKPIVMCFTGNSGNKLEFANGFAKAVGNTAKTGDNVELISIKYREKHSVGVFSSEDVQKFVDCFFLPLLQKDGRRLSIEQVKRNFRKITIVTHCYGAEFLKYINNVLQDRMLKLGFKDDKIFSILKSLIHIGYAPYSQSNYNTNFYFKSVNDKTFLGRSGYDTFGEAFEGEAKYYIQSLPPKERKKYYIKDKMYLGNGLIENNGNLNFYTENLTGTILKRNDDHRAGVVLKNNQGKIMTEEDNLHTHTTAKCFEYILQSVIKNSIQNETENKSLDIKEMEKECNKFIDIANASETEIIKRMVLKNSLEHISPEEAMKRMQITEKDFLKGKVNVEKIDNAIVGIVDWGDSLYKKLQWVYTNPSVCFREYSKENIRCTELSEHKEGIILCNGELAILSKDFNLEYENLSLLIKQKNLKGSVKYRIMKRNGKTFIALSDNYGSRKNIIKEDFDSQIKHWKEEYKEDKLSVDLTEQQNIVIKNLCVFFDIADNNIKYKKDTGINI